MSIHPSAPSKEFVDFFAVNRPGGPDGDKITKVLTQSVCASRIIGLSEAIEIIRSIVKSMPDNPSSIADMVSGVGRLNMAQDAIEHIGVAIERLRAESANAKVG